MAKKLSQNDFLLKASDNLAENLNLGKVAYKNMTTPITIICNKHNLEFLMKPQKVLIGQNGCPDCRGKKLTTADFVRRAEAVYGDTLFDFSETVFTKMADKVTIVCRENDSSFEQLPQAFLKGNNGCADCNGQTAITRDVFVTRSVETFGASKFDYSFVKDGNIKNMHSKINIRCIEHDEVFTQEINVHLRPANGCPKCNKYSRRIDSKLDEMIAAINIDGKYDYSMTDFSANYPNKVEIKCITHKTTFWQTLNGRFSGREGCSKCSMNGVSKREQEVADFIRSLDVDFIENDRKVLNGKEIDIYVPRTKIGIEFNGLYWHSEKFLNKNYHYDKALAAEAVGVRLLQVWEDDWVNRRSIVESHIRAVLGCLSSERVFARKTNVRKIDKIVASDFLNSYHIQGFVGSSVYLGLYSGEVLVAVACFLKNGDDYILSRYCTSYHVVGGHGKVIAFFEANYNFGKLITFADRCFSDGGLYLKTGWVVDGFVPPDYSYVVSNQRQHKFGFRKSNFESDPNLLFDESMTERELAELNDLVRVWDAGKVRFVRVQQW